MRRQLGQAAQLWQRAVRVALPAVDQKAPDTQRSRGLHVAGCVVYEAGGGGRQPDKSERHLENLGPWLFVSDVTGIEALVEMALQVQLLHNVLHRGEGVR